MPELREPKIPHVKIPLKQAQALSSDAFTKRIMYEANKQEREETAAIKKEQEAAKAEAQKFIDTFLDNPEYRIFVQLLENNKLEDARAVGNGLGKYMNQLAEQVPELKKPLEDLNRMMIGDPLAEKA